MLVPLHGIGTRHDLPLPFSFVVTGAALALVLSFVVLFLAWRQPRFVEPGGRLLSGLGRFVEHPVVRWTARGLVLALFAWVALGAVGGPDNLTNPVFGFVYVWLWVGLVPLSILLGPVWRVVNPVRTIHRGLAGLARIDRHDGLIALPRGLGVWPAAVALFGFAWLELIEPDRTTLAVIRVWALAWLVLLVIGAVAFGEEWIGSADPFEAYATTVAQLSPWRRVQGALRLVNPVAGLSSWEPPAGSAAVVATLLGSTAYDSFTNNSWWIRTVQSSAVTPLAWGTAGLLAMIGIVLGSFALAAVWMHRYRRDPELRPGDLPRLMAGSVVPIVVGYAIAHYLTLLVVEGQRTAINLSDPLGIGWNVLGSARMGVNQAIFDHPTAIAVTQVVAIVGGHLLGIVVAHERSLQLVRPERALIAQVPMLAVMVGYTCAGLVLLFAP
ncbi:MAG TPA: hypothetical protein VFP34_19590 [Microlunatus sp.]|nr:hypothetical protein [Microlunatus sp.]